MEFSAGPASNAHLEGVAPDVVACVRRAYKLTRQDFNVYEGVRGKARQAALVAAGASRAPDSHHLLWTDGFGHAVDLVPWVHDRLQWQTVPGLEVARAMHGASTLEAANLTWGGVWDRLLHQLDPDHLDRELEAYALRWHAAHPMPSGHQGPWGPLVDIWHFQGIRP